MLTTYRTNPIYAELGLKTVIHAGGTKTTFGGSRIYPEVFDAMRVAAESFVNVEELNRRIGAYIASVTNSEAAMVTSGAASGMVLSLAACMTGTDLAKARRLPCVDGMKDEVIMQKIHRGAYSHMYEFTGAKILEIGNINDCSPEELESSISERTAAVAFLLGPRISKTGLTLRQVVKIAHANGVPVIVDAAAMLPPKENLKRFTQEGADLITFSGGKFIHGPQNTGILFGKKELIDAALVNANPNHGIGRPHKVSKEDMVGLYVSLKLYLERDEAREIRSYEKKLSPILLAVQDIDGITSAIHHDEINHHVPSLVIQFDSTWAGPFPEEIPQLMLEGEPSIFLQYFKDIRHLTINPINLADGEELLVAEKLRDILTNR